MESLRLSAEEIMTAVNITGDFFADSYVESKDVLRIKLATEEILIAFQQELGEKALLELYLEKRFGTPRVVFRIPGASFDPFGNLNDDDRLMHNLMENMGTVPVWNYRHSCNEIVFTIEKKKKLPVLVKILIAVVLGIGLGLLARFILPETITHDICTKWMTPVQNAVMGLLSCLSALFIMLSVTGSIYSMGDITTFNRIGRRLIFTLLINLLIVIVLAAVFLLFFFPLTKGSAGKTDLSVLWQMLIDIVPTNIIESFSTGNTIQIVFLSIVSSVTLLIMGPKAQQLADVITQLTDLLQRLIQGVTVFMPLVVFTSLFSVNADGDIKQFFSAYKYPLFLLILCILFLLVKVSITSIKYHISPRILVKKLLPTMLIAFSTSSSSAALPENMNTCENRLGIDRKVVNIGIALGQTIYMPSTAFTFMCGCLCATQIFNVSVTLPTYLILVFTVYVLAVATPPIPGSAIAVFSLLMTQMGIPSTALAFLIALDPITDRISTCTFIAGLQMELVGISDSLNMLNKENFRAK